MTRYVFSQGRIQVLDGIILKPEKRHHPLQTATMFIVCNSEILAGSGHEQQLTRKADIMSQQAIVDTKSDDHS
jgi:hypothetical protein